MKLIRGIRKWKCVEIGVQMALWVKFQELGIKEYSVNVDGIKFTSPKNFKNIFFNIILLSIFSQTLDYVLYHQKISLFNKKNCQRKLLQFSYWEKKVSFDFDKKPKSYLNFLCNIFAKTFCIQSIEFSRVQ